MSVAPAIVWFRQDLRLQDNPALRAALSRDAPVVPLYVLDNAGDGRWPIGGAARWWLHHSLAALDASLRERGSRLILARGENYPRPIVDHATARAEVLSAFKQLRV